MKSIAYKSPIPLTLFGHDAACYNKPALMVAIDRYVVVSEPSSSHTACELPPELVDLMAQALAISGDQVLNWSVKADYGVHHQAAAAAYIVGGIAYGLHIQHAKEPTHEAVQQKAYEVEKAYFKRQSHAQTVASTQGGLVFYRKEFEFYKSVFRLPMKLPEDFLTGYSIEQSNNKADYTALPDFDPAQLENAEKRLKRAVLAIQSEDLITWRQALNAELQANQLSSLTLERSDKPSEAIHEDHKGVQNLEI